MSVRRSLKPSDCGVTCIAYEKKKKVGCGVVAGSGVDLCCQNYDQEVACHSSS